MLDAGDEIECIACLTTARSVRFRPCGHSSFCAKCTIRALKGLTLACPFCRTAVKELEYTVNPQHMPIEPAPRLPGALVGGVHAFLRFCASAPVGDSEMSDAEVRHAAKSRLAWFDAAALWNDDHVWSHGSTANSGLRAFPRLMSAERRAAQPTQSCCACV